MDYIREAEQYLREYNNLYKSINEMNSRVAKLVAKAGPSAGGIAQIDETGIRSGKVDNTLNLLFEIKTLTDSIKETKKKLAEINQVLGDISQEKDCELYGPVLRKWYIEKKTKEDIAEELGYSITSLHPVYKIRNRAIRKFAIRLFGIEALKAV